MFRLSLANIVLTCEISYDIAHFELIQERGPEGQLLWLLDHRVGRHLPLMVSVACIKVHARESPCVKRELITSNQCQDHKPGKNMRGGQYEYVNWLVHHVQVLTVEHGLRKGRSKRLPKNDDGTIDT